MAQKTAERQCPVCKQTKTFEVRSEACSLECGFLLRRQRAAGAAPNREALLRLEMEELRSQLNAALRDAAADARYQVFIGEVASRPIAVPEWLAPSEKKGKAARVVATAFLSDCHFDEVVDPRQINGMNEYNRSIAEKRLQGFFKAAVRVGKQYMAGVEYVGIVVPLGGDMFSGSIHEELRATNEAGPIPGLLHWVGPIIAGLRMLADEYGRVFVPAVVGNHGRNTHKPIHKGRVRDNFDWLLYRLIERELASDKRVSFAVSESPDITYSVFGTRYCLTHGDQFRGGSGISGALAPLMLGDHRKRRRAVSTGQEYDYMIMGHWHQLMQLPGLVVNGSLKGYDEYAFNSNFGYQEPGQAFWLTSEHHKTIWAFTPLYLGGSPKSKGGGAAFAVGATA